MKVIDTLTGQEREFPECPECLAAGQPSCYPAAPSRWYPIDDLPQWHEVWMTMLAAIEANAVPVLLGCGCLVEVHENTLAAMREHHPDIIFPTDDGLAHYYAGTAR